MSDTVKTLALIGYALGTSTAAALLAACGESQLPIAGPGTMPRSHEAEVE